MWIQDKALRAPGVRSACAVACGAMLAGAVVLPAWADEQLQPLVVTATRVPTPLSKTLADVTVLGAEELARVPGGNVGDALRGVPGVEVIGTGGSGNTTSVFVRGGQGRHVMVLLDGVPLVSQNIDGVAPWEAIPLAQIERIEVVRGAASAVYGAGAVSGVVQLFTKRGTGWSAGLGVATDSSLQGDLGWSQVLGDLDLGFHVAGGAGHGINAKSMTSPGTPADDRDGFSRQSASLRAGYKLGKDHRVDGTLLRSHQRAQYDDSLTSTFDDHVRQDIEQGQLSWRANWLPNWQMTTSTGESRTANNSLAESYQNIAVTRTQTASVVNQVRLAEHSLRVIADHRRDRFFYDYLDPAWGDSFLRARQRTNGLGLAYGWDSDEASVSLSGRADRNDRYGWHKTGAVAGSYQLLPGLRVRASYGTAFVAPTLYHLYSQYGNVNLQPERSRTRELGLAGQEVWGDWSLTAYHTRFTDMVDYQGGKYLNVGLARSKGLEAQVGANVGEARVKASLNWNSARNIINDDWLTRRARVFGLVRVEQPWMGWSLGAQAQFSGRRADLYYDEASETSMSVYDGGYVNYGLDASRQVAPGVQALVKVSNLSDHRYQTAYGYNMPGRTVSVAVRWTPKD